MLQAKKLRDEYFEKYHATAKALTVRSCCGVSLMKIECVCRVLTTTVII